MLRKSIETLVCAVGLTVYSLAILNVILVAACWEFLFPGSIDEDGGREIQARGRVHLAL